MAKQSELYHWLPAILWTLAILWFSGNSFSANQTGGWLAYLLGFLVADPEALLAQGLHFWIRKAAHLSVYFILGICWAWPIYLRKNTWFLPNSLQVMGICVLVAALDETHQAFVASRVGSIYDVAIDTLGAGLGQLGWGFVMIKTKRSKDKT